MYFSLGRNVECRRINEVVKMNSQVYFTIKYKMEKKDIPEFILYRQRTPVCMSPITPAMNIYCIDSTNYTYMFDTSYRQLR